MNFPNRQRLHENAGIEPTAKPTGDSSAESNRLLSRNDTAKIPSKG